MTIAEAEYKLNQMRYEESRAVIHLAYIMKKSLNDLFEIRFHMQEHTCAKSKKLLHVLNESIQMLSEGSCNAYICAVEQDYGRSIEELHHKFCEK